MNYFIKTKLWHTYRITFKEKKRNKQKTVCIFTSLVDVIFVIYKVCLKKLKYIEFNGEMLIPL